MLPNPIRISNPILRSGLYAAVLCALANFACAPTNSNGSMAGQGAPAPADSVAFAFIPRDMANYPDYQSFRETGTALREIMDLDLALRECDFATEEIGGADFPLLQKLSLQDAALGTGELRNLHFGSPRLLLIMDIPSKSGPTSANKVHDAVHNTFAAVSKVAALANGSMSGAKFESTREYGHAYRAVYFDRLGNRILFDTTSSITTVGQRAPGQRTDESYVKYHYKQLIASRLPAKRP